MKRRLVFHSLPVMLLLMGCRGKAAHQKDESVADSKATAESKLKTEHLPKAPLTSLVYRIGYSGEFDDDGEQAEARDGAEIVFAHLYVDFRPDGEVEFSTPPRAYYGSELFGGIDKVVARVNEANFFFPAIPKAKNSQESIFNIPARSGLDSSLKVSIVETNEYVEDPTKSTSEYRFRRRPRNSTDGARDSEEGMFDKSGAFYYLSSGKALFDNEKGFYTFVGHHLEYGVSEFEYGDTDQEPEFVVPENAEPIVFFLSYDEAQSKERSANK